MTHAELLWSELKAQGMLTEARVCTVDAPAPLIISVGWASPDAMMFGASAQSAQTAIEYLAADLPDLAQGDEMEIEGRRYKVRQPSFVSQNPADARDGVFRLALLSLQE